MADEFDITEQGRTRRRTPEELAELSANVALANERYHQSTTLAGRFEDGAPGAFEPGGALYNSSGRDFGYAGRGQARERRLQQGEEKLDLERDKFAATEINRDRGAALNESQFAFEQAKYANTSRRERDIADQAADFLIAERDLDPSAPNYEAQTAALLKGRPYALAHPEVQSVLKMNTSLREEHAKLVNKGGAEEFSGPAQEAFHREIKAHGSAERARAHALTVKAGEEEVGRLRAAGFIDPATDLAWGTEKDADGVTDIPAAKSKNENFILDPESPHYGEVNYSKLIARGQEKQGKAVKDKVAQKEQAEELHKAYGISPAQLLSPISAKPGKIDDWSDPKSETFGKFVAEDKLQGDKGNAVQVDVGSKVVTIPLAEYNRHLALAKGVAPAVEATTTAPTSTATAAGATPAAQSEIDKFLGRYKKKKPEESPTPAASQRTPGFYRAS